jgi:hypothetical protein
MSTLANWVITHRRRLGLTAYALGNMSGISHRILYHLEQRNRSGVSARTLLQLATFFQQQDPSIDVSLPTLLALTRSYPPGRGGRRLRPPVRRAA